MAALIDVQTACGLIHEQVKRLPSESRPLNEALGRVLSEDLPSRLDSPPYDKSLVDGFAISAADLAHGDAGEVTLSIVGELFAGDAPDVPVSSGQAIRIMTGAPIPDGADLIIMRELAVVAPNQGSGEQVCLRVDGARAGQHIMRQGAAIRLGAALVSAGARLRPIEIGVLADSNYDHVPVTRTPRVATIQTGDELVPLGKPLGPSQIVNSNGPLLRAMTLSLDAHILDLGIVADRRESLQAAIHEGLQQDVLILSGGVSVGDRDLVPELLAECGVQCLFHKVALRPGKPIWFGIHRSRDVPTLVFGLPGNPVSGLVCFHLFVAPALRLLSGFDLTWNPRLTSMQLADDFELKGGRPAYWPGKRVSASVVRALSWLGSADPFTLVSADCLIVLPEGNRIYRAAENVEVSALL